MPEEIGYAHCWSKSESEALLRKSISLLKEPKKCVTIVHDKMDHSKTSSPHFSHNSKHMDSFMKLSIFVMGMIAHGHGDVRYAHYGLDIFPTNSNYTVGSIAKLLRDLELPLKYSLQVLFLEAA